MVWPEGQQGGFSLQELFDERAQKELPRIEAFGRLLMELGNQLRNGKITEREFFEGLTADKEPLQVLIKNPLDVGSKVEQPLFLNRIEGGKLEITQQAIGTIPSVTGVMGLSGDGHLQIEEIVAHYEDKDVVVSEGGGVSYDAGVIQREAYTDRFVEFLKTATPYLT